MARGMWRLLDEAALAAIQARLKARKVHPSTQASAIRPARATAAGVKLPEVVKGDYYSRILAHQIRMASLPAPVFEYPFARAQKRKWRIDLAWPSLIPPLAVEVTGHVHRIKARFQADFEKEQALFKLGWLVLRILPKQVVNGEALELVRHALGRG